MLELSTLKDITDRIDGIRKIRLVEVNKDGYGEFREEITYSRLETYSYLPKLYDFQITENTLIYFYECK